MPYTVTHILVAILLLELFREYVVKDNRKFPRYYILIVAIGAIIPDLDVVAYYILYFFGFSFEQVHRTFLHTIFIPLIFFLIGLVIYKLKVKNSTLGKRHMHLAAIFFILAFGSFIHLILDLLIAGKIAIFWPISNIQVGMDIRGYFPLAWQPILLPSLDTLLLVLWICWMEFKLKITKYF